MKVLRRIGRIILIPAIAVLSLLLFLMIAIQIPAIQTKAAHYVVGELNKSFNTQINLDRISIDYFGDVNLYGVTAKDDKNLEFINIKRVQAQLSLTALIKNPDKVTINKLNLFEPKVKVITYKGDTISNFIALIDKFSNKEKKKESNFKLKGKVKVKEGELLIQNQNLEGYKQNWVDAKKLNFEIDNFRLENDEIWADLKSMNFETKRNGEDYKMENLAAKFHLSDKEIRFDELQIKTEDSELNGHLVFSFDSNEDLKDFEEKVQWDVAFEENSKVNVKDIRYFVENFNKNSTVEVIGKASGTLNDMVFSEIQLKADGVFVAANELTLTNMTDGTNIEISSKAMKAKTTYHNLTTILPTFIAEKIPNFISRFGNMDYSGDFNLDPKNIKVDGYAITSLGDADLKVNLTDYRQNLKYEGSVIADNFNLHQITGVKELGFVAGRMEFSGQGLDVKNLNINADGNLAYMDLMGKRYHNVNVDGRLDDQKFNGLLSINDAQLQATYDGLFDFSRKPYKLDFSSKIRHINLDYLGLTKNMNAQLSAVAEGKFTFSNLDDFLGTLELDNVHFKSKKDDIFIPHAHIISANNGTNQSLELDVPGYLKGEVHGKYRLSQLPDAIMNTLGTNALITYKPKKVDTNQKFSFYFEFGQDLLNIIDNRIKIESGTIIDGFADTSTNSLVAELSSTEIGYDGFNIYNPLINIDTSKDGEQIYVRSDSLLVKSVMMYDVGIHTTPIQDSLLIKTNFHIGKKYKVDFDLNLFQTTNEKKNLVFGFSPSTIKIDETVWNLNPNNDRKSNRAIINFDKNYYELQGLLLESEEQRLLLDGYYASQTNYKLNADLQKLMLSKIIPNGLLGKLKIDGIANGTVDIIRTKDELKPLMELKVDQLALNDYGLGDLGLNGSYNVKENVFDVELYLEQKQVQVLYANGYIDNKPEKPEMNIFASLDAFNLNFLESFLSAAMSNVRGMASGNVRFTGPVDSPDFEGMLDIADLGFKVDYLNVDYAFDGINTVPVSKQSGGQGYISLDGIQFRDTKYGTKGEVTGQLLFRDFASWFLNLSFNTKNLLVLNTNINHNDLFYGKVFGQGAFELFGPPEKLDISAKATVNEGSEFTINTGATKVEGSSKLVRFIPEANQSKEESGPKGMNIDLDISASPSSTVNLIFDPVSGDMVTANGSTESLKFKMSRTGQMSLDGVYTLDHGKYEFRQVPLMNRDFDIKKGSYVSWSGGGPFDANMHITANFEKTVSNVGEFLGAGYSQSYDVVLGIVISESLANPQMDFTLNIPKGGADVQSLIDYKFNLDPDNKMIQFGAILLFGQFMTDNDAVFTAGATSTGAGIALKQLGGIINSLIAGGGISIGVDYVTGSAMSGTSDMFKGNMKVNLSPRWTFNGMVGVPMGNSYANETTTGEAEIEWDVSRLMDKTLVIDFFTRPTNFGVQNFGGAGNFQSFGAGITYKTSFDRFSEIFDRNKNEANSIQINSEPQPQEMDSNSESDSIPTKAEESIKADSTSKKSVSQSVPKKDKSSLIRFK